MFALASTIYYILTGKALFTEFESDDVTKRHMVHALLDLADIPYAEIIKGCWLQEFASAHEVMELLKRDN
jgi:hypothetical protein